MTGGSEGAKAPLDMRQPPIEPSAPCTKQFCAESFHRGRENVAMLCQSSVQSHGITHSCVRLCACATCLLIVAGRRIVGVNVLPCQRSSENTRLVLACVCKRHLCEVPRRKCTQGQTGRRSPAVMPFADLSFISSCVYWRSSANITVAAQAAEPN